ncbi:hypothetical protein, partial [uncultured Dialister sp.]|uniref:hypothetical protein n=1 Tax=uncultured Dialister sp. TaxID=278064 RepID=UPI0026DC1DB6
IDLLTPLSIGPTFCPRPQLFLKGEASSHKVLNPPRTFSPLFPIFLLKAISIYKEKERRWDDVA